MRYGCFIQNAEYGATKLYILYRLQALFGDGLFRANECRLVPVSCKTVTIQLKQGFLASLLIVR